MTQTTPAYKLTKKTLNNGTFEYSVTSPDGTTEVVLKSSKRTYVACTANGSHFFGRLDLITKGEYARYVAKGYITAKPIAYLAD